MPLVLSEDGMFFHLNGLKLIFMLPVWELITQDSAAAYLEAQLVLTADVEICVLGCIHIWLMLF